MSNSKEFNSYAERVKKLTKKPSNETLLNLYGYYKQATVGNNNTPQPSALLFKDSAKWKAWHANDGLSKQQAESKYIALVKSLL